MNYNVCLFFVDLLALKGTVSRYIEPGRAVWAEIAVYFGTLN